MLLPGIFRNPILGTSAAFGIGAGLYAGAHTFVAPDPDRGPRADQAKESALNWTAGGSLAMFTGIMAARNRTIRNAVGRVPVNVFKSYAQDIRNDYVGSRDQAIHEAKSAMESRFNWQHKPLDDGTFSIKRYASFPEGFGPKAFEDQSFSRIGTKAGISKLASRKGLTVGLATGAGAAVGALLGHHLDKNDPNHGAKVGAVIGGGAGLAGSMFLHASKQWSHLGGVGKTGIVAAASMAIAGIAAITKSPDYETVDVAPPRDSGVRDRMNRIGATGDLVFGLHRGR